MAWKNNASFLVDISGVEFDEGPKWIQAMPLGNYVHPLYGPIDITPDRVKRFADGVKAGVRGQDLDIDYDHKAQRSDAAGWVKDAEARADGLWLLVEWTREALGKIKEKAYRYFSPEFNDEWEHPATKQKFTDVLFGGALTNRPFLKGILPINLSEAFDNAQNTEGVGMDPKELRKQLGLAEDATDEAVTAKITELNARPAEAPKENEGGGNQGGGPASGGTGTPQVDAIAASEALKQLSETNPAVKLLMDTVSAQGTQLADTTKLLAEMTVEKQLSELDTPTSKLTPAAREAMKHIMLGEDVPQNTLALAKLTSEGKARVDTTEGDGRDHDRRLDETSATSRFIAATNKFLSENKELTYAQAVVAVATEDPQLYAEYTDESYSFKNPIG